jgi:hypothetical protein
MRESLVRVHPQAPRRRDLSHEAFPWTRHIWDVDMGNPTDWDLSAGYMMGLRTLCAEVATSEYSS